MIGEANFLKQNSNKKLILIEKHENVNERGQR